MHFIKESFITLCSFCLGIFICLIYLLFYSNDYGHIVLIFVIYAACSVLILRVLYSQNDFQVTYLFYFILFISTFLDNLYESFHPTVNGDKSQFNESAFYCFFYSRVLSER